MTLLNFPPTNGQPTDGSFTYTANGVVYTWDGEKWTANTAGSGGMGTVHFTGDSPPPAGEATETDQWFNTNDGRLYTYTKNVNGVLVWADASPDSQGDQLWDRNGTTLEPANAGDDVDLGSGDLSAAAGTFNGGLGVTGEINVFGTGAVANVDIKHPTDVGTGRNYGRLDIDGKNVGDVPAFTVFNSLDSDATTTNKFIIQTDGGVRVGGTNTSPNITLNANGIIQSTNTLKVVNASSSATATLAIFGNVNNASNHGKVYINGQGLYVGNDVSQESEANAYLKTNGDIKGNVVRAASLVSELTPEQQTIYGISELDIKGRILSFITRIEALEAKVQQLEGGN